jgi:hypothetical protein
MLVPITALRKDDDAFPASSAAMICIAMTRLMSRELAAV